MLFCGDGVLRWGTAVDVHMHVSLCMCSCVCVSVCVFRFVERRATTAWGKVYVNWIGKPQANNTARWGTTTTPHSLPLISLLPPVCPQYFVVVVPQNQLVSEHNLWIIIFMVLAWRTSNWVGQTHNAWMVSHMFWLFFPLNFLCSVNPGSLEPSLSEFRSVLSNVLQALEWKRSQNHKNHFFWKVYFFCTQKLKKIEVVSVRVFICMCCFFVAAFKVYAHPPHVCRTLWYLLTYTHMLPYQTLLI